MSRPTPVTAIEILPGSFFAWAINCGKVLIPSAGLTAMNIGFDAVKPIGRKSRGSRSGKFGATDGSAAKVESAGMNSV